MNISVYSIELMRNRCPYSSCNITLEAWRQWTIDYWEVFSARAITHSEFFVKKEEKKENE